MSIMTTAPAMTGDANSWNDGYLDGQIAALTNLSSRRAHARASMADQYDQLYAQGYIEGFQHGARVNAAFLARQGGAR